MYHQTCMYRCGMTHKTWDMGWYISMHAFEIVSHVLFVFGTYCNSARHCNTLTATHWNTLQHTCISRYMRRWPISCSCPCVCNPLSSFSGASSVSVLQCVATQTLSLRERERESNPLSSFGGASSVSVLQCVAVRCSVVAWDTACCSELQCVAWRCSVLQCVKVRCFMQGLSLQGWAPQYEVNTISRLL